VHTIQSRRLRSWTLGRDYRLANDEIAQNVSTKVKGNHPLESWKVHPYWLPEDHMTPEEIAKQREADLKSENIKKRHDEIVNRVNERMANPEKYKKKPDPARDILISDASFIFNKYMRNPHLKDFSHIKLKVPEPTCKAILSSWDRLWLQPSEGEDAVDYFYLGKEPPSNLLKEKEAGKIEPGLGVIMAVDCQQVEQATAAQRSEWNLDKFLSLFPQKTIPKYGWPRFTWRQSGQKAIRSAFPFALWTGEFNFVSNTESIIVWTWIRPKSLLQEAPETSGLGFETFRTKEVNKADDPDSKKFWEDYYTKYPEQHPSKTVWPIVIPAEKTKIQWDYIEGAPDQE